MAVFMMEEGMETTFCMDMQPLRRRVSISEIGSCILICSIPFCYQLALITPGIDVLSDPDAKRDYDIRLSESVSVDDDVDDDSDEDEFSRMADYEFYSGESERFLIDGKEMRFENARHIIIGEKEYIIVDGKMINIGGISRFNYEGEERYRIDGVDYVVRNAEHYYQSGNEYVVIEGKPYLIKRGI